MKKVFYESWIAKLLIGCHTITIGPFIFTKKAELTDATLTHECIHVAQWSELTVLSALVLVVLCTVLRLSAWVVLSSILTFYVWYGLEFIYRFVQLWDFHKAYRAVSFEVEAYGNEGDLGYLYKRKYFSFL